MTLITDQEIQQVSDVSVSSRGHEVLADRRRSQASTQIDFINSAIGQLASEDVNNVT